MNKLNSWSDFFPDISQQEFFARYYGEEFLLTRAGERLTSSFSWDELNACLEFSCLSSPRMRIARNGKIVPESEYATYEKRKRETVVHVSVCRVRELVQSGAVLIVDSVHELLPSIKRINRELTDIFGEDVRVNLYLGGKHSSGFPTHWDVDDTFIVQVFGRKNWQICPNDKRHPLPKDKDFDTEAPSAVTWEGTLEEGSLLHIPRGLWHRAWTTESVSCHLTITIPSCTGIDILKFVLERCGDFEIFRRNVPASGLGDFSRYLHQLTQRFVEVAQGIQEQDFRQKHLRVRSDSDSYRFPDNFFLIPNKWGKYLQFLDSFGSNAIGAIANSKK